MEVPRWVTMLAQDLVPGPLPICRASVTVTAQATAASAVTAIHGPAS